MRDEKAATVLVVDDEPLVLLNAAEMIEEAGWAALEAANSAEALQVLENHAGVDVLFTDINMPGEMDGLELAACVHAVRPNVHLVITSGKRMLPDSALPNSGTFLPKPYSFNQLVQTIADKLATGRRL